MEVFTDYLAGIRHPDHRGRLEEMLTWVARRFPQLEPQIKWNTPMFTDHGTFIIAFSAAKQHVSVSPEEKTMRLFAHDIARAGYSATKGLFRIPWNEPVHYDLLADIIAFNIRDKAGCSTFWRK
ncbi:iron chaperone [Cohnella laeviribosi]|uniref:iron chaperone n=1 Tax=Cohnella laeviribosi TaxID=380174 RepID=UPI00036836D7|nr:iron chaperone [Cohnella laeviribosi]